MPVTESREFGASVGGSVLAVLRSPAFPAVPPEFIGAELIPPSVRQACSAWAQPRFGQRDVTFKLVRDVFVAAEGLVFDREGEILPYSIRQHEPELVDAATQAVRRAIAGEAIERYERILVLGKKRGAGNFGHWMIEMLPMLFLVTSRLADERIGVLVHDVTEPNLGAVMQETLRRIGVADSRVCVSGLDPVFVRELIMVEGLTDHGAYMSPLVLECHDRLAHGVATLGIERVFLSRGEGMTRRFRDEAYMARLAAERGFSIAAPGGMDLDTQIGLMRDARLIAGVMGAGMTNLIHARAGARAALFAPASMPDTFFWFIANLRGLHYREIRCRQSGAGEDWDRELEVGFRVFRRVLDQEVASLR